MLFNKAIVVLYGDSINHDPIVIHTVLNPVPPVGILVFVSEIKIVETFHTHPHSLCHLCWLSLPSRHMVRLYLLVLLQALIVISAG